MTFRTKDSGIEWVGHIPSHWSTRRIKFLANREENSFIDGDWIESPYVIDKGIPYFTTGNIGDGVFKPSDSASFISKESFEELKCKFAYGGDLIFSRLNAPYGRSCLLPLSVGKCVIAVDNVILRTDQCKEFVCYVTQCPGYQKMIEGLSAGTAMKRISRTRLGNVKIPLPPLAEQRSIATFLNRKCCAIDSLIASKQALLEKLEEYRKAVITKAVMEGLNPSVILTEGAIRWIGKFPSHWKVCKIKHCYHIVSGATPPSHEQNWGGNIPWIGPADMPDWGEISGGKRFLTKEGYAACSTTMVPAGSIILSTRAPIGKVCIAKNSICTNQGCKSLVARDSARISNKFTAYCCIALQKRLQNDGTGTTFQELSLQALGDEPLVQPPIDEQISISNYLDAQCSSIDSAKATVEQTIDKLNEYKQSLITAAVTGKIDVTNIHPKEQ